MNKLVAILAFAVASVTVMTLDAPMELEQYWWVYLVSGEGREKFTDEERADMQAKHMENLTRLWKEGKSTVAGPFSSKGPRRGISVAKGKAFKNKAAVLAEFKDDPYVANGLLKVEVYKWWSLKGALHEVKEDAKMKQYVFVIYNRPKDRPDFEDEFSEKTQAAHLAYNFEMKEKHKMLIAGPFEDAGKMRGLLIFDRKDIDGVKKLIAKDPWVKAGGLEAEFLILWAAQGAFGD